MSFNNKSWQQSNFHLNNKQFRAEVKLEVKLLFQKQENLIDSVK